MFRFAPLLFIVIPLIELYFIIVVGEMIGAFWTVMLVIATAILGVNLLRMQGMSTLGRAQRSMSQGQIPAQEMMEGVALAVAGVLLITPGFITDTIGFLLLFPVTRQLLIRGMMSRASIYTSYSQSSHQFSEHGRPGQNHDSDPLHHGKGSGKPRKSGRVIEGEYTRED
jgi:UPF0716 protein FxsA